MSNASPHFGTFVWREINTPDIAKSTAFYAELFGWKVKEMDMGTMKYPMFHVGEKAIGGAFSMLPPGVPAHWMSYVAVDDVDAAAGRAKAAGGQLYVAPQDIPNVGRFSVVADRQGACLAVFKGKEGDAPPPSSGPPSAGEFCWEQLNTGDSAAGESFWRDVVGWTSKPFPGGGGMSVLVGARDAASVMQAPPGVPAHWLTYVVVPNLAAARERAVRLGGKVMMPHLDVPGVGAIGVIADNVGAMIGLHEPPKQS